MSCQICNRLDAQPSRQREDLEMRLVAQFRKRSQRVFRIQLTLSISLTLLLSLTLSALAATLSLSSSLASRGSLRGSQICHNLKSCAYVSHLFVVVIVAVVVVAVVTLHNHGK